MAQSIRTRVLRIPKREHELHLNESSIDGNDSILLMPLVTDSPDSIARQQQLRRDRLRDPDYQAPLTARTLRPNSRWLIVRRNLHRIRFMGYNERARDSTAPDLYIGFQMKRELKRAQEEIKNIDKEENFQMIKQFALAVDTRRVKTYDTSHVQPNDALIYDRLGEEPLALQNLLYYFSKQDVAYGTLFWDFLNEVNRVLNMKRKRTVLVKRLRRLALTLAIVVYVIIGLMFFFMIISVITTATRMNDPEVEWVDSDVATYSNKILSTASS